MASGVWAHEEYEKLRMYDNNECFHMFLCHQSTVAGHQIACKGFLNVHQESVAVRLALLKEEISPDSFTPTKCELHESGNAAADFGERDIKHPKTKAKKTIKKLTKTGKFKT